MPVFRIAACICLISSLPLAAAPGGAQPSAGVGRQGRPLTEQRSFTLTEVGAYHLLDEDPVSGGDFAIACDVGRMWNVAPHHAVGGTLFAEVSGRNLRGGARARARRWLGRTTSAEISAGLVLLMHETSSARVDLPIPVARASLNLSDLLSLTVQADHGRYVHWEQTAPGVFEQREFTDWNWRVGGNVGSVPGAIGAGLFVLVATLWVQLDDWD
jgi:hypothetical protein